MNSWFYFCILIVLFENVNGEYADDEDLNITQIINKYGYPVETHEIETSDGYLLDVYRVPHGRRAATRKTNRYPVLAVHGLLASADMFIFAGPRKSLAYMLADNGYDVWLCNTRGTWHSRKHRTLNPDRDREYWQFSFHENGIYDLPATIDYILNVTNQKKLHYVGHSQGTTSFFVMGSERPEYNAKIKVMIAMAPSAILRHFKHRFLGIVIPSHRILERFADQFELYELKPLISNDNMRIMNKALCGKGHLLPSVICDILLSLLFDDEEIDKAVIHLAMSKIPAGGSVKQGLHYAQLVEAGKFQKYDWGPEENMRKYNSRIPPEYNLKNVTTPVALFYGEFDDIVPKEDVQIVAKLLPNVIEMYQIPNWGHYDFLWGKNIDVLLNNKVIDVLVKYNNQ